MNINEKFYCSRCMQELPDDCVCTYCHYDPSEPINIGLDPEQILEEYTTLQNGRYLIGTVIGVGGFGITYSAFDTEHSMPVAIKEYFPSEICSRDVFRDENIVINSGSETQFKLGRSRAIREANSLSLLRNVENVVNVFDAFVANNTAYIVMEYIRGVNISDYIKAHNLAPQEILQLMKSVVDALISIHDNGVLHRDITPSNILVQNDGTITLIDFGASTTEERRRQNKDRTGIFTNHFSAIEQYYDSDKQGPCTDVYGLSAVLYTLICGEPPEAAPERVNKDTLKSPIEQNIPLKGFQSKAIMQGLAVKPNKRIQTMKIFKSLLYEGKLPEEVKARKRFMLLTASAALLFSVVIALLAVNFSYGLFFMDGVRYSLYFDGMHARGFYREREKLNIPQTALGIKVVQVDDGAFQGAKNLYEIYVAGSVRKIGSFAFNGCENLSSVSLAEGVETISSQAFSNCNNLQAVIIPNSLNEIAEDAFMNSGKRLILLGSLTSRGAQLAKQYGINYAHIDVRDNDTGITLLKYDTEQNSVYVPDFIDGRPVTEIASDIPGVAVFPHYVHEVNLPQQLTKIGDYAFNKVEIAGITLPNSLKSIGELAFAESFLETIELPDSVNILKRAAFMSCVSLNNVKLSAGMKEIPAGCFNSNNRLQSISIPEGVETIGALAFGKCPALSSIELPESLNFIGNSAFMDCIALKTLYMPSSVNHIGFSAFDGCPNDITVIGYAGSLAQKFSESYNFKFYDMNTFREDIEITPKGNVIVDDKIEPSESIILPSYFKATMARRISYAKPLKSRRVIMPIFLEEINTASFYSNKYLQSISLPNTVKRIGGIAFANCSELVNITLNEGLEEIGTVAFAFCASLKEVKIPKSLQHLGAGAFTNCKSLASVDIPSSIVILDDDVFSGSAVSSVVIPGSISKCGTAFYDCQNLRSATLEEGIRTLWGTFAECRSLESVIIPSTMIQISRSTFRNCGNLKDIWIYSDNVELDFVSWGAVHTTYTFTEDVEDFGSDYVFLDNISNPLFSESPNLTIHARRGSSSHVYANSHGIKFEAIETAAVLEKPSLMGFKTNRRIYSDEKLQQMLLPSENDNEGLCWEKFRYALGYGYGEIAKKCLNAFEKTGKDYTKKAAASTRLFLSQSEYTGGEVVVFFEDGREHPALRVGDIIIAVDGNEIHSVDDLNKILRAIKTAGKTSSVYTILRPVNDTLKKFDVTIRKGDPLHATLSITPKTFEEK